MNAQDESRKESEPSRRERRLLKTHRKRFDQKTCKVSARNAVVAEEIRPKNDAEAVPSLRTLEARIRSVLSVLEHAASTSRRNVRSHWFVIS